MTPRICSQKMFCFTTTVPLKEFHKKSLHKRTHALCYIFKHHIVGRIDRGCGGSVGMWWLSGDVVAHWGCGGSVG
jgi:hypothetical protein